MWGSSPLAKHALRYQNKEENSLELIKIAQDIAGGPPVDFPTVDPRRAVLIGHELSTGRPVAVNPNVFTTHGLVIGGSGAGKTTILMRILCVLVRRLRIRAIVNDHKGEGRRLLPLLGDQVRSDSSGAPLLRHHRIPNHWQTTAGTRHRGRIFEPECRTE